VDDSMHYQYKFEKILTIKEKEKNDSESKYTEAVKEFESEAENLYQVLKKKEELLDSQSEQLKQGLSVQQVRYNQDFLDNHEKMIAHYQKRVMDTRSKMHFYHQLLIESNVEVKKYEKIKEKDFQRYFNTMKYEENRQMDEISIQQYMSRS